MNRSGEINELVKALASAQAKIRAAPKDNVASIDSQKGKYSYRYSTLADVWEACRLPLAENGLAVVQTVVTDGAKATITTLLAHSSGQWIEEGLTLAARDASPQAIGSCITYGRRYALSAMVGVVSDEDDDGAAAQPKPPTKGGNGNGNGHDAKAMEAQIEARLATELEHGFADWKAKRDWRDANKTAKEALPREAQLRLSQKWVQAKPFGTTEGAS